MILPSFPSLPRFFFFDLWFAYNTQIKYNTKWKSASFVYYTEWKPKNKIRGKPGNKASTDDFTTL